MTSSIEVDEDLDTVGKLSNLAKEFRDTGLDKIKFLTVPNEPYEPNPNRLVWTHEADDLWERIRQDQQLGQGLQRRQHRRRATRSALRTPATHGDGGSDGSGDVETQATDRRRPLRLAPTVGWCHTGTWMHPGRSESQWPQAAVSH